MSDPFKQPNHESDGKTSRDHDAMNMDATFVPESPPDAPQEETDYSATITGMPLPVDDDEEFDSQRFDDGVSNADMVTFVPIDEDSKEEAPLDNTDATFVDLSAEPAGSTNTLATIVPDQINEISDGDSFSGTVISEDSERVADTSTIINQSGEGLAAERGERPEATIEAQRRATPEPGRQLLDCRRAD
ncbi:MAG: hypothetical protein U0936_15140 [Planctomycetaceae bacterium]